MTETSTPIPQQLADVGANDTIDGIPVWELGEDGDLIITVGHVDPRTFANACDNYALTNWAESLAADYEHGLNDMVDDVTHRWMQIIDPREGTDYEFEVEWAAEGYGTPVTVWTGA